MLEDVVNPAVPSTTGALLAEEWTINPLATLPSFLEMFMMDEASRSARKSLDAGMAILREKLQAQLVDTSRTETMSSEDEDNSNTGRRRGRLAFLSSLLSRLSSKFAATVAHLIQHYGPEISCLILYSLERHCLRSDSCATISESLYGGRQAKLDRSPDKTDNSAPENRKLLPLTDRDKTRMALLVAVGPYIRHRLFLWYQNLKQQQFSASQEDFGATRLISLLRKLRNLFIWIYPMLHVSLSSMDLVYQWRYLLGKSVFFHPYSHMLGLVVRRVTQEDTLKSKSSSGVDSAGSSLASPNHPSATAVSTDPDPPSSTMTSASAPSSVRNVAVWVLSSAVILSWVSHFRSEYQRQRQELIMQQEQEQHHLENGSPTNRANGHRNNTSVHRSIQGSTNAMSTVNPPPPSSGLKNTMPAHLCPLCRQPRIHPTASSSGFVFCYKCLLQHVKDTGKCPVTSRDCGEAQLLRLYEPNHSISN